MASSTYNRNHYERNKPAYAERNRRQRARVRQEFEAMKAGPCTDCGVEYPPWVMQWDHVRGEKVGDIARLISDRNYRKAREEVEKCELVCANCHAERTHARRVARDGEPEYLPAYEKEGKVCEVCGATPYEKPFRADRKLCVDDYNRQQAEKMRQRRAGTG